MLSFSYTPEITIDQTVEALKKIASALLGRPLEFSRVEFAELPDQHNTGACFQRVLSADGAKLTSRVENGTPPGYNQEHILEVLGGTVRGYGGYFDTTLCHAHYEAKALDAHYETIRATLSETIGKEKDQSAMPFQAMVSAKTLVAAGEMDAALRLIAECKTRIAAGDTDFYTSKFEVFAAEHLNDASVATEDLPKLTGPLVRELVGAGDLPRLKLYFERGLADEFTASILPSACYRGQVAILAWILEATTFEPFQLQGALKNATIGACAEAIPLLIAAGADINQPSGFDDLPLATASFHGNLELAQAMITAGADPNIVTGFPNRLEPAYDADVDGQSPVLNALREGHVEMVRLLLESGADPNLKVKSGRTLLEVAETRQQPEMVTLLRQSGARSVDPATLDLTAAAKRGLEDRVRDLLPESSVEQRDPAMMIAQHEGHHDVAQSIAEVGLSEHGYSMGLRGAVSSGRVADARYFVAKGADPLETSFGVYLIHHAAGAGHGDMLRYLLEVGMTVDQRTDDGDTPLHRAAANQQHDMITLLLSLGADANAVAGDGSTPLSSAHDDASRALLTGGGSSKAAATATKGNVKKKLKSAAKNAYAFKFTTEPGGPAVSRFGGLPGLLPNEAWPKAGERHLRFFAQVDFSNLPKSAQKRFGKRMLQVFLASDVLPNGAEGTLLRWVNADELVASEAPEGVAVFAEKTVADFKRASKDYPLREYGQPVFDALGPHEQSLLQQINKCGDKTGGWPHWIQEADYPRCGRCSDAMNLLVLQIDSHHALDHSFGDNGAAYVLACPKHLDELKFSYQCS